MNRVTMRTLLGLSMDILHDEDEGYVEIESSTLAAMIDEIERWRALNIQIGIRIGPNYYECPMCKNLDKLNGQGKMTMRCSECQEIYSV